MIRNLIAFGMSRPYGFSNVVEIMLLMGAYLSLPEAEKLAGDHVVYGGSV